MRKQNHRNTHGVFQPNLLSIKRSLIAAGFATVISLPAWTAQLPDAVASDSREAMAALETAPSVTASSSSAEAGTRSEVDPESLAHSNWSAFMARNPAHDEGCFHAAYPDVVWQRVPCKIGEPRVQRGAAVAQRPVANRFNRPLCDRFLGRQMATR